MYQINTDHSISLAQGDTMAFRVRVKVNGSDDPARFPDDSVAVFAISKKLSRLETASFRNVRVADGLAPASAAAASGYSVQLYKPCTVKRDGSIIVYLSNQETRALAAGDYIWDIRIVTNPEYDEAGNVICEQDSDQVISIFSGAGTAMPKFTVTEVAAVV